MKIVLDKSLAGVRAVVIGSGPAGLGAAVALAARGARVRVLERDSVAGGRLAPRGEGVPLAAIDPFVFQPHVLGQLFALADLRLSDFVEFRPVEPVARLLLPSGETFHLHADPARLADEMGRLAPAAAERFLRDLPRWERQARIAEDHFLAQPGRGTARLRALAGFPPAWPFLAGTLRPGRLATRLRHRLPGAPLAEAFEVLAARHGASTRRLAAGFLPILFGELLHGCWVPTGGVAGVREALLRVCELLDIRVVTNASVERIQLENDVVRHVAGQGFKTLRADLVVSTIGLRPTLEELLTPSETRARALRRLGRPRPARSTFLMGLRCSASWETFDAPMTVIVPPDTEEMLRQLDDWSVPAARPPLIVTNLTVAGGGDPAGPETLLRVEAPMPPVSPRFRWSEQTTRQERDRLVRRLEEAGGTGLGGAITAEQIVTPGDLAERMGWPAGSLHGTTCHRRRGWLQRPGAVIPEFRGLLVAGAETHPGSTLPMLVLGGMLAAEVGAEAWPLTPPG
ncbi:MAG: FAD-dependent oxidoreductase [Candidatus Sumerlaeia bacterium]|nr:FAD-dependent oxidoreductase [Candidatus Sumerlaeia bacterium]